MKEKLYSLGTVILLKNTGYMVMIMGYYPMENENEKPERQYFGVNYLTGITGKNDIATFCNEDIVKVCYEAETDEETEKFLTMIYDLVEKEG